LIPFPFYYFLTRIVIFLNINKNSKSASFFIKMMVV